MANDISAATGAVAGTTVAGTAAEPLIRVEGIEKTFGTRVVLRGVDFRSCRGRS